MMNLHSTASATRSTTATAIAADVSRGSASRDGRRLLHGFRRERFIVQFLNKKSS
jgi:hypothetical protein